MESSDVRNILQTYTDQINKALDALRDDVAWSVEYDDQFSTITKAEVVQVYTEWTEWTKQEIKKVLEELTNGNK